MKEAEQAVALRRAHVARYIRARGVQDARVLQVMEALPRERFAPAVPLEEIYADSPMPLDHGQTVSQPYMVARMSELLRLRPEDRVLEIGTGSGYQTAVLASLAARVFTVERIEALSERARRVLETLDLAGRVDFRVGDGSLGWPEVAPFDAICVTAGAPAVPPALKEQVGPAGRLVIPVGDRWQQELLLVERDQHGTWSESRQGGCRFVPLWGKQGWGKTGP